MSDVPLPPLSDLMDVDTTWGRIPLWKARAMRLAYTQTAMPIATRADDAATAPAIVPAKRKGNGMSDERKPPPLKADASKPKSRYTRVDKQGIDMIMNTIADPERRLDEFEAKRAAEARAEAALTELEDAMARRYGTEEPEE
jgi:hypothetical protein